MRLVLDANLSPSVAEVLREAEFDASHVGDQGLLAAADEEILDWTAEHGAIVVTADSDFAMLLALRKASSPSVVHLRGIADSPLQVMQHYSSTTWRRSQMSSGPVRSLH